MLIQPNFHDGFGRQPEHPPALPGAGLAVAQRHRRRPGFHGSARADRRSAAGGVAQDHHPHDASCSPVGGVGRRGGFELRGRQQHRRRLGRGPRDPATAGRGVALQVAPGQCPGSAYRIAFGPRAGQKVLTVQGQSKAIAHSVNSRLLEIARPKMGKGSQASGHHPKAALRQEGQVTAAPRRRGSGRGRGRRRESRASAAPAGHRRGRLSGRRWPAHRHPPSTGVPAWAGSRSWTILSGPMLFTPLYPALARAPP